MDAAAAAKAWADAAEQLKDKKQLETACVTIARLANVARAPNAAVRKAVVKLKLPKALLEAAAAVLGERKRQRDWRAETYALRVGHVTAAFPAVLHNVLQPAQQPSSTTGRPSNSSTPAHGSSSSTAGNPQAAQQHASAGAPGIAAVPDALWDSLLPKLVLAMQDVAAVFEKAVSSSTGSTTNSSSSRGSSSTQAEGMLPLATVSLPTRLLNFAAAVAAARPGGLFRAPGVAALGLPAAHLAVVALRAAAAGQQTAAGAAPAAEVAGNIECCIRAGWFLLDLCKASRAETAEQHEQQKQLMCSNGNGQVMLVMLAVQTQLLLQEHFPLKSDDSSSSSSSSSSDPGGTAAAAAVPALYHVQLWQDLGLPRSLLDQAAAAYRKLTDDEPHHTFLLTVSLVSWALQFTSETNAAGHPAAACDLSTQQLQLAISAMRVPLLLMDVADRVSSRLSSGGSLSSCCGGVFDMKFVSDVVHASHMPMHWWRVLGTASSGGTAGSGSSSISGTAASSHRHAARHRPEQVNQVQLSSCWDTLLQQLLQMARSMLAPPSAAGHHPAAAAAAAAAASSQQACSSPPETQRSSSSSSSREVGGSSGSSSSKDSGGSSGSSQEQEERAAVLSCCQQRLRVVLSLGTIVNRAAELHHQQQQQEVVERQQACRGLIAEMLQLLQQHLREVLLPPLCAPTADLSTDVSGGEAWSWFCTVMAQFCGTSLGPSPAVELLLDGASSPTTGNAQQQQQQQQLFGLLLSMTKGAMRMSHLPRTVFLDAEGPVLGSATRKRTWKGGASELQTVVAAAAVAQRQQRRLLLARVVFVGSKLAAAHCAAWAAGEELEGAAVAEMHKCLSVLLAAAAGIKARIENAEPAAAAAVAAPAAGASNVQRSQQQQLQQQLAPLMADAARMVGEVQNREDRNFSRSDSICMSAVELVEEVTQQLEQWALAFCGQCSVSSCCNNPACTNLARSSEQALVGGRQCVCSGCMAARFCSRECQVKMWPHHKQLCKDMKRQQRQQQQQQQQQDVQGQQDQEQDLLQQQQPTE